MKTISDATKGVATVPGHRAGEARSKSTAAGTRLRERSTRQKRALAAALASSARFRSAQDLHADLRAGGERVGLTTVYAQLKALAGSGDVDVLRASDGESLYRRCATAGHHHHVVCRHCGRTAEVEGTAVEAWVARVTAELEFADVDHTLELVGTCARCAAATATGTERR
jgi:Fur family transcriptional regulator, ferric uptake regulator